MEEIEELINVKPKNKKKIDELSSKFYTVIPQAFGRGRPPPIDNSEILQNKYDMVYITFLYIYKYINNKISFFS